MPGRGCCAGCSVEEALARYGQPEIFNTDQGAQFASTDFTGMLQDHGIAISMDGKGCWKDNIFVERLWRSIKYEEVYLHAYASVSEAKAGLGRYLTQYNTARPHSSLADQTPAEAYFTPRPHQVACVTCLLIQLSDPLRCTKKRNHL